MSCQETDTNQNVSEGGINQRLPTFWSFHFQWTGPLGSTPFVLLGGLRPGQYLFEVATSLCQWRKSQRGHSCFHSWLLPVSSVAEFWALCGGWNVIGMTWVSLTWPPLLHLNQNLQFVLVETRLRLGLFLKWVGKEENHSYWGSTVCVSFFQIGYMIPLSQIQETRAGGIQLNPGRGQAR